MKAVLIISLITAVSAIGLTELETTDEVEGALTYHEVIVQSVISNTSMFELESIEHEVPLDITEIDITDTTDYLEQAENY